MSQNVVQMCTNLFLWWEVNQISQGLCTAVTLQWHCLFTCTTCLERFLKRNLAHVGWFSAWMHWLTKLLQKQDVPYTQSITCIFIAHYSTTIPIYVAVARQFTVCMACLVFVLCQPYNVHPCIELSLHGVDFFLEIFWRLAFLFCFF